MTYAELLAEIKLLSKRGDLDDKIAVALRLTTLRAHRLDYFWKDHKEVDASFASSSMVTLDVSTALTGFRQINYVQCRDPSSGAVGAILDEVEPSDVIDNFGYFKTDAWYLSGTNLNINFSFPQTGVRIGYWQNPDVTPGGYNSWIATDLSDILVQGSLAYLFNITGKQEEARALNRMVGFEVDPANRFPGMTLVDQLKASNIRGTGRA